MIYIWTWTRPFHEGCMVDLKWGMNCGSVHEEIEIGRGVGMGFGTDRGFLWASG